MILLQANQIARHFGAEILFENIHLEISTGARIALVGRNGAGKSTLLKILTGIERPDEGTIAKNKAATLGYLAQDTGLDSAETVWNEMLKSFETIRQMENRMRELEILISEGTPDTPSYESLLKEYDKLQHDFSDRNGYGYENEIRSVLHGFKFDPSFYDQKINELSGGQRTRLALARMLLQHPDILILDEPTNHLDIDNKEVLENALIDYDGTLLFVSHDRYFINRIATKVIELSENGSKVYLGDYDYYLEKKQEEAEIAELLAEKTPEEEHISTNKKTYFQSKEQQKLIRSLQRKITQIEEELAILDEQIEALEQQMVSPENLDDHLKLNELNQTLEATRQSQETKLSEWEDLSIELEEYENE
ncbi:ABC-F family ATP-binding cassette domain-containing protein [Enterococcus hirae]